MAYWAKTYVTILTRATHWMAYFDLRKLNELELMYWKCSNPNCNDNRRDKVAMRTTCIRAATNWSFRGGAKWCKLLAVHNKYIRFWKFLRGQLPDCPPSGCGSDLHQKCQVQDYQNKDMLQYLRYFYYSENLNWVAQTPRLGRIRLSKQGHVAVCRILLQQRKSKLGRTKSSTGPRVGHSCSRPFWRLHMTVMSQNWRQAFESWKTFTIVEFGIQ